MKVNFIFYLTEAYVNEQYNTTLRNGVRCYHEFR